MTDGIPRPPSHLRAGGRALFADIAQDRELEAHHVRLLTLAAEALDRGERARTVLAREGLTYTDKRGTPRARPENAIARDAAVVFARLIRELRLDGGPTDDDGRPPRLQETNGHPRRGGS